MYECEEGPEIAGTLLKSSRAGKTCDHPTFEAVAVKTVPLGEGIDKLTSHRTASLEADPGRALL